MEFAQLLIPVRADCLAPDVIDSHDGNKLISSSWISQASGSMCIVFHSAGLCSPSEIIHLCPRWLFASSTFLQKADSAGCPPLIYQWFRCCLAWAPHSFTTSCQCHKTFCVCPRGSVFLSDKSRIYDYNLIKIV